MSALPKGYYTPEAYLALDEKAEYRSQYVSGEIFAMAGAESWHVEITGNIAGELRNLLRGKNCKAYSTDLRVRIDAGELWTYPDVAALGGSPRFDSSSSPRSLLNPQVIFEVLSPSTEAFDRGDKFARYRRIESLTDYVLVASEKVLVEHFVRQEAGAWILTEYTQMTDRVPLLGLDCHLPLEEIYYRVAFPDTRSAA